MMKMKAYTQPVKVDDIVTVTVENIGQKKDGISRYQNFVIIVPDGQVDKTYKVKITKVFEKFAFSTIVNEVYV